MRTTSSLESMNAALRRISRPRPSVFRFIECIKMHEFSKSLDLMETIKYGPQVQKSKKVEKLDVKIKQLSAALEQDPDMNPGLFLEEFTMNYSIPDTGMTSFKISVHTNYPIIFDYFLIRTYFNLYEE